MTCENLVKEGEGDKVCGQPATHKAHVPGTIEIDGFTFSQLLREKKLCEHCQLVLVRRFFHDAGRFRKAASQAQTFAEQIIEAKPIERD